jgi:hypothetical protein
MQLGGSAEFTSFYLVLCISPDAISRWIRQRMFIKYCKTLGWIRRRPWQLLDKRLGKKEWVVHGKSKLTETEIGETGEEQSLENAHHFLWYLGNCSQWICSGKPNAYCCYILRRLRNVQNLPPELWRQRKSLLLHYNASSHSSFSTREFFYERTTWQSSPIRLTRLS